MAEAPFSITISPARVDAPRVSVLVPICNVERYLEECLDSLVAQYFTDFEAICINDGSTDGSRAIIQRYMDADKRFRVIDKPNSGYGASMNMGLANAVGEYIAILESDDFFEPNALELLVDAAERNQSDVVKADFYLYWSTPQKHDELFHIVDDLEIGRTLRPIDDLAIFFRKPSIWSALYRANFLRENGIDFLETPGASYQDAGFNFKVWASAERATFIAEPVLHYRQDNEKRENGIDFLETPGASYQDAGFNFKVWASAERATFIAEPVLHYRQDNEKSSVNSAAKVYCVCDEYASMTAFVNDRFEGDSRLMGILECMKFDSYMWNFDRLSDELREEFVSRASEEFAEDLDRRLVDFGMFDPWTAADLRLLASDPARFLQLHARVGGGGAINTMRRLLSLGGPALVLKTIAHKLGRKSIRRSNARGGAA